MVFDTVEDCINKYFDKSETPEINVFEAGLYVGNTAYRIIDNMQKKGIEINNFTAADSFCGLPEEKQGVVRSADWAPGNFSAIEAFGTSSIDDAVELVQNKIKPIYPQGIRIIVGWFNETLNIDLAKTVDGIDFFHCDTDLFISTEESLNWLFSNKIINRNCIVRYDDYASCNDSFGQKLAHIRATHRYNIEWEKLSYNCYRVASYDD